MKMTVNQQKKGRFLSPVCPGPAHRTQNGGKLPPFLFVQRPSPSPRGGRVVGFRPTFIHPTSKEPRPPPRRIGGIWNPKMGPRKKIKPTPPLSPGRDCSTVSKRLRKQKKDISDNQTMNKKSLIPSIPLFMCIRWVCI